MAKTVKCARKGCGKEFKVGFVGSVVGHRKFCKVCRVGLMEPGRRINGGVGEVRFGPFGKPDHRTVTPAMLGQRPQSAAARKRAAVLYGLANNPNFRLRSDDFDEPDLTSMSTRPPARPRSTSASSTRTADVSPVRTSPPPGASTPVLRSPRPSRSPPTTSLAPFSTARSSTPPTSDARRVPDRTKKKGGRDGHSLPPRRADLRPLVRRRGAVMVPLLPILGILSFVLVLAFLVLTFRSDYTGERDLTTSRDRQ